MAIEAGYKLPKPYLGLRYGGKCPGAGSSKGSIVCAYKTTT